jgi:hypothetical protein
MTAMRPGELEGILNAHAFLRVERPPELWAPDAELELFVRALGEMISVGLARNGLRLAELTLNVSNVVVESDGPGSITPGDYVAVTIRGSGDWRPEAEWKRAGAERSPLVTSDLDAAVAAAGAAYGYSRVLGEGEGSVTVFFARSAETG